VAGCALAAAVRALSAYIRLAEGMQAAAAYSRGGGDDGDSSGDEAHAASVGGPGAPEAGATMVGVVQAKLGPEPEPEEVEGVSVAAMLGHLQGLRARGVELGELLPAGALAGCDALLWASPVDCSL
jgi:hypothetical protein